MADEPISALTLLSSYSTADEVEILDVSDTTFASTGTNKRIQFASLLTMAGVGTVAGGGTGLTAVGSADQLLGVAHTGGALEYKTLTAGSNITITPAAGAITVASTLQGLVFPETYGALATAPTTILRPSTRHSRPDSTSGSPLARRTSHGAAISWRWADPLWEWRNIPDP